jgi:hypothetical protein
VKRVMVGNIGERRGGEASVIGGRAQSNPRRGRVL